MAYVPIKLKIEDLYGGSAKIRMAVAKAVRNLENFDILNRRDLPESSIKENCNTFLYPVLNIPR